MKTLNTIVLLFFLCASIIIIYTDCSSPVVDDPEVERSYSKTIERVYTNEFERALIDSAEAAYPPRDSVVAVAPDWMKDQLPETGYWFHWVIDGVLIPYAITIDAIEYYSNLIDSLEDGVSHQHIIKADFDYRVSISFKEEYDFDWPEEWNEMIWIALREAGEWPIKERFERVFVVKKLLYWFHHCGETCALWLYHVRIVIFDESGNLIKIFLDGDWWVPIVS